MVLTTNLDILGLCETWLKEEISDQELNIPGYQLFRRDRISEGPRAYGGVAIYIKDNIVCNRRMDLETDCEILWLEFDTNLGKTLFGIFYNPSSQTLVYLDELEKSLQKCANSQRIILCGDLNIDMLDSTDQRKKTLVQYLTNITDSFGLKQLVDEPTRITQTSESLIDHAYVSQPLLNSKISVDVNCPLGRSDHCAFIARIELKVMQCNEVPRTVWLYNKANWVETRAALRNLPSEPDEFLDLNGCLDSFCHLNGMIDSIWQSFYDKFMKIMSSNIPQKRLSKKRNLPWVTGDLKKLITRRNRLFKKAKLTNSSSHWDSYKKLRNTIVMKLRQAKRDYFDGVSTAKDLWAAYKLLSGRESLPVNISDGNSSSNAPDGKANLFNDFFARCFEPSDLNLDLFSFPFDSYTCMSDESGLSFFNCTSLDILEVISGLDSNTAVGPDNISAVMLKETSYVISPFLSNFFNLCFESGCFPKAWKHSNVVPIFKSGDKSAVSNYRPISLQSLVSKIMERIVHKQLYAHLDANNHIPSNQFGFLPGRSTGDALLTAVEDWFRILDRDKSNVGAVFFDLSKAFDKVSHSRLAAKLNNFGISGPALRWFADYLTDRSQSVTVQGAISSSTAVTSGVPQGSILGPLLFVLFTADINQLKLNSKLILYADDMLVSRVIKDALDMFLLQEDSETIARWVSDNDLLLNAGKTKFMLVTNRHDFLPEASISVQNTKIERVTTFKYLGVTLSSNLSWSTHIDVITRRARRLLGFLYRSFYTTRPDLIFTFFKSVIRPILDYNCIIWNPHLQRDIKKIEDIQILAMRMSSKDWTSSRSSLVTQFNGSSLVTRRNYFILSFCYKFIHGLTFALNDLFARKHRLNLRYDHHLAFDLNHVKTPRLVSRLNFISYNAIQTWNHLPSSIATSNSIARFKYRLKNHLNL